MYKKERMDKNREGELGLCFRAKLSKKLPNSAERALQHLLSSLKRGKMVRRQKQRKKAGP